MSLQAVLWKDLRREWRRKEGLQAGVVTVALFLVLDILAFQDLRDRPDAAALLIWTPLVFATAAVMGRSFAVEHDQGTMEWLRSAPVSAHAVAGSRTLIDGAIAALIAALTLGGVRLLFGVPVTATLVGLVFLGVVGLTIIGTLAGGLAAQAQVRALLLPILLVPAAAPLLVSGVPATVLLLEGGDPAALRSVVYAMMGYDLLAAGIAWFLWPVVLEGD